MFKRLIAVILSLLLVLGGMGKPAYAYSEAIPLMNIQGSNTGSLVAISSEVVQEAITLEVIKAGVSFFTVYGICFGANALATSVFPGAIALMPYCAAIGATFTGGVAVGKTPVKLVVRKAFNMAM